MFATKKFVQQKLTFLYVAGTFLLLVSCGNHTFETSNYALMAQVTFCNESSYSVTIHKDNFGGPVLAELLPADCISIDLNPSDNHGTGTVFSVEYWHLIENDILVGGKDPDRQIIQNIKAGENPPISIPQPKNLDLQESFIKILNASDMDFELRCLSMALYQVNKTLSVQSSKSGLYNVNNIKNSSCFSNDEIKGLTVKQGTTFLFPEFTIINGYIYNFKFDGNEVIQNETEKIILQ